MVESTAIIPGVTLHWAPVERFKQSAVSIQFVRPMNRQEASLNALLPSVLLRGSQEHPDLRSITLRLDDLYGAAVSAMVRRIGDCQTTGLYCGFMEDRFALKGDRILEPMMDFLGELLRRPLLEDGVFREEYVESEKKNIISAIEAQRNDKRIYAAGQLLTIMCREDSFGVPRLGEKEDMAAITPGMLYAHYEKVLRESPVEVFYVGSAPMEQVAALVKKMFAGLVRSVMPMPPQTPFHDTQGTEKTEIMDVAQAKLNMGFVTPITNRQEEFTAMQVMNTVFGAGMTSKLFMNVREKLSLCYSIGSGYYGSKGILTVSAGIDADKEEVTRREIMAQLDACCRGEITPGELTSAKEAMLSSLRTLHDSPGAIEGFYGTAAISGFPMTVEEYGRRVEAVTVEQVAEAAASLRLHTVYFLKGGSQ